MKISGFTIARNVIKYNYPIRESIESILPICDEFIVNMGDSEDGTEDLLKTIKSDKIRIIRNKWDMSMGKEVLSYQTNLALDACCGDWAFYLQSDEVVHEADLPKLVRLLRAQHSNEDVDAIRFRWFHFYGSYFRYRIDSGWYQKQDRIIRNNKQVISEGDAFGFKRKDGKDMRRLNSGCYIYHYGWVHPPKTMQDRRINAEEIGFVSLSEKEREGDFQFGQLEKLPIYFGSHPKMMLSKIENDEISKNDLKNINRKWWWYPPNILNIRYKSGRRMKEKVV